MRRFVLAAIALALGAIALGVGTAPAAEALCVRVQVIEEVIPKTCIL